MEEVKQDSSKDVHEYTKPAVTDYGDLRELTAASTTGSVTDVPLGGPGGRLTNPAP